MLSGEGISGGRENLAKSSDVFSAKTIGECVSTIAIRKLFVDEGELAGVCREMSATKKQWWHGHF